jgi:hypothetical protein
LPAALYDRHDQFTILIAAHKLRTQDVRSTHVTAPQIGAVASSTAHAVQRLPALDHHGIARRPRPIRKRSRRASRRLRLDRAHRNDRERYYGRGR